MGIKGSVAWRLMTEKVSQNTLQSLYEFFINQLFMENLENEQINQKLKEAGLFVGERLLVDYSLIKKAPKYLNWAGIADTISIITALVIG